MNIVSKNIIGQEAIMLNTTKAKTLDNLVLAVRETYEVIEHWNNNKDRFKTINDVELDKAYIDLHRRVITAMKYFKLDSVLNKNKFMVLYGIRLRDNIANNLDESNMAYKLDEMLNMLKVIDSYIMKPDY